MTIEDAKWAADLTLANAHANMATSILAHPDVAQAVRQARANGIDWPTIITTILGFLTSIFSGGTIDWAAIVAAILALFQTPPTLATHP
jgi:hypothetical protein